MPWRTLCGFPPTADTVTLRIPNGAWRPDTVITDYEGTEMFVLLDQTQEMRSYEAIFGDLEGRRLVCIKRHIMQKFWKDGYYFCTYKPNYQGQKPLAERDVDNKKVYPFSYMQVNPMKGRFYYRYFDNQGGLGAPRMKAENPWLGFMVVCCTPMVRCGKWTASFRRRTAVPTLHVDQWRNCVDVGPGNDLLAALCMAYVFDRYQCQPLVTVFGMDDEELEADDKSIASQEDIDGQNGNVQLTGGPEASDDPLAGIGDYGAHEPYSDQPYHDEHYQDNQVPLAGEDGHGGHYDEQQPDLLDQPEYDDQQVYTDQQQMQPDLLDQPTYDSQGYPQQPDNDEYEGNKLV